MADVRFPASLLLLAPQSGRVQQQHASTMARRMTPMGAAMSVTGMASADWATCVGDREVIRAHVKVKPGTRPRKT